MELNRGDMKQLIKLLRCAAIGELTELHEDDSNESSFAFNLYSSIAQTLGIELI
jgi:hypothetical protein